MVDTWGPMEEWIEEPDDDSPYCDCNLEPTIEEFDSGICDCCGKVLL